MSCLLTIAAGWSVCGALAAPAVPAASEPQLLDWLLSPGEPNVGLVLNDSRFRSLLSSAVPRINVYLGMSKPKATPPPLIDAVREVMGGITALNLLPSIATTASVNSFIRRHSATNWLQTRRMAGQLSLRKSAIVLKSGAQRPVSQINSRLRCASRSSRRLEGTRLR